MTYLQSIEAARVNLEALLTAAKNARRAARISLKHGSFKHKDFYSNLALVKETEIREALPTFREWVQAQSFRYGRSVEDSTLFVKCEETLGRIEEALAA